MNLIVRATGTLGSEISRQLLPRGQSVRASSDPARVARLRSLGADIIDGDLRSVRDFMQTVDVAAPA